MPLPFSEPKPKRTIEEYLSDILISANKAIRVTRFITYDDFERHDLLPDVVMRQIEIIGEASKAV
jgi:uncharacterized protein with HEPN domain